MVESLPVYNQSCKCQDTGGFSLAGKYTDSTLKLPFGRRGSKVFGQGEPRPSYPK